MKLTADTLCRTQTSHDSRARRRITCLERLQTIVSLQRRSRHGVGTRSFSPAPVMRSATGSHSAVMNPLLDIDRVVYEDSYCKLYHDRLEIKFYYFPFALKKTVRLRDVFKVSTESELHLKWYHIKHWGIGLSWIWWAMDTTLPFRSTANCLVVKVHGDGLEKGFTCSDPSHVKDLIMSCMADVLTLEPLQLDTGRTI